MGDSRIEEGADRLRHEQRREHERVTTTETLSLPPMLRGRMGIAAGGERRQKILDIRNRLPLLKLAAEKQVILFIDFHRIITAHQSSSRLAP